MFDFTSFGVILLLGGSNFSTLEVEIYLRVLKLPNLPLAALLSIIQLLFTLIFSILYTRIINQVTAQTNPRFSASRPPKLHGTRFVFTLHHYYYVFLPPPRLSPIRSSPASKRPRTTRRSPIWIHNRLLQRTFHQSAWIIILCSANSSAKFSRIRQSHRFTFSRLVIPPRTRSPNQPALKISRPSRHDASRRIGCDAWAWLHHFLRRAASPFFVPIAHTSLRFHLSFALTARAGPSRTSASSRGNFGRVAFRVWQTVDFPILSRATLAPRLCFHGFARRVWRDPCSLVPNIRPFRLPFNVFFPSLAVSLRSGDGDGDPAYAAHHACNSGHRKTAPVRLWRILKCSKFATSSKPTKTNHSCAVFHFPFHKARPYAYLAHRAAESPRSCG